MGNSTSETDQPNQLTDLVINPSSNPTPGAVLRDGKEILFQAFNWESHKYNWWETLETKIADIAKAGITSAWLPPPTHSFAAEGYAPQDLYSLNSKYGSEHQLKALLHKMKQHKVRAMADIVINHRVGTTRGRGGIYNRFDGISLPWDERAVTSSTGGLGKQNSGAIFHGFPNIDHSQDFVRKDIIGWLQFLRHKVGFQDFRFDFAKGFSPKYVKEYIEGAKPVFSVGEYWDTCNYVGSSLDYNQDSHRQRIVNWIDGTGQLSTAFDFTTKGILQEAVKREYWRLCDAQGKPPGVIGWWPSRSATFIDNHDTGSTQAHWPFPSDHVMEGYAYILTHPGIPTIFYDHFYDWNHSVHEQIVKLIDARKRQGIHSRSPVRILEAKHNVYAAIIGEKLCMKIGDGSWSPSGKEWTLSTSGHNYAVWHK
ncbi:probable alpha-amylase 2 [Lathyrus oleraceus]|uniref:Alpha-amylase n=1 Tax=Pisum sativum TaxID=3888 RepID=A0A9D5A254_PEA|nr:probable alpha-amylase 2 [Pisum sativum]KAI5392691.1 variant 3, alpha-amylase 2 [Pisum sativum]